MNNNTEFYILTNKKIVNLKKILRYVIKEIIDDKSESVLSYRFTNIAGKYICGKAKIDSRNLALHLSAITEVIADYFDNKLIDSHDSITRNHFKPVLIKLKAEDLNK
jgi:glycyl-tRNA synthetase beta subunit